MWVRWGMCVPAWGWPLAPNHNHVAGWGKSSYVSCHHPQWVFLLLLVSFATDDPNNSHVWTLRRATSNHSWSWFNEQLRVINNYYWLLTSTNIILMNYAHCWACPAINHHPSHRWVPLRAPLQMHSEKDQQKLSIRTFRLVGEPGGQPVASRPCAFGVTGNWPCYRAYKLAYTVNSHGYIPVIAPAAHPAVYRCLERTVMPGLAYWVIIQQGSTEPV